MKHLSSLNTFTMATAIFLVLSITGCGAKPKLETLAEGKCVIAGVEGPDWACSAYEDDTAYTATGSAYMGDLGHGFSRQEAMAVARSNLAQQIEIDVKDKVETFMRSTGVANAEVADKVTSQVSKQTARITLQGSKQIAYWENSGDDSIYVLVSVNKDSVYKVGKSKVLSSFKNDNALWQQFQASNALEALEKEFDR